MLDSIFLSWGRPVRAILLAVLFLSEAVGAYGSDTFDGTYLTIPLAVVGSTCYSNVKITVLLQDIGVAGGPPSAGYDTYDSKTHQLFIPSVLVGSTTYTNVSITVGSVVSVGGSLMGGAVQGNPLSPYTNVVTTIAGTAGSSGSADGTGTSARFHSAYGITTNGANLYVTDTGNFTIRKISLSTGSVTTIAGTAGSSGLADGIGSSARFNDPWGITTDGINLYVGDNGNNSIRMIDMATGAVTTIAGIAGYSGSNDGTGSAATFNHPAGVTTDGTNLYVADTGNFTIRKIVKGTGVVSTVAGVAGSAGSTDGTGSAARFNYPKGITTDGTNLYVTDNGGNTIRKIVIATGAVTTIAGTAGVWNAVDGTGASAIFNAPTGITTDGTNLYVPDNGVDVIRKVVISSGVVTTIAGTIASSAYYYPGSADGVGAAARFNNPQGTTTDGINLYVADAGNSTIRKISTITTAPSAAPTNVTVNSNSGNGLITFTWNPAPSALGYNLYCAAGTSVTVSPSTKITSIVASQYQLGDIVQYSLPAVTTTTYTCIVTAYNNLGEGMPSSPVVLLPPTACSNGATNYPACTTMPTCSNGATNYPTCTTMPTCSNGATNYPTCTTGGNGDWYMHWNCNGDQNCISIFSPNGQPSGSIDEGPSYSYCASAMSGLQLLVNFYGSTTATASCTQTP